MTGEMRKTQWILWTDVFWMEESYGCSWQGTAARILRKETEEAEEAAVLGPGQDRQGHDTVNRDQGGALDQGLVVVLDPSHSRHQGETGTSALNLNQVLQQSLDPNPLSVEMIGVLAGVHRIRANLLEFGFTVTAYDRYFNGYLIGH